ncbi:hypothetical protein [Streptomyces sp. NPDC096153]|uniref:hypothetical protein n=1 Tax=Streptomyces sp. NPDC096153 TaxID=3155548 RepID=UPI00331E9E98
MSHTPGARVRITIDGFVQAATTGELRLVSGTRIESYSDDVHVDLVSEGFQTGDVANDGKQHLLRIAPHGEPARWITPDGTQIHDESIDPTRLAIVSRATTNPTTEEDNHQ